jgi:hypothetical protein
VTGPRYQDAIVTPGRSSFRSRTKRSGVHFLADRIEMAAALA